MGGEEMQCLGRWLIIPIAVFTLADGLLTTFIVNNGGIEINPMYGSEPNFAVFWAMRLGFLIAASAVISFGAKAVPRFTLALALFAVTISVFAVVWNVAVVTM